jgi:PBP1b-binding outer membrane lipoprotein LpoB
MEFNMKRLAVISSALVLSACASSNKSFNETKETSVRTVETTSSGKPTEYPTIPDFEIRSLTRTEVIAAVDQCKDNGMKPFVEYISQKTPYGRVMTPVNVHCNPNRSAH